MNPSIALWIAACATVVGAVFSALYMSLADLRKGKLEELTERLGGASAARRVQRILSDLPGHARAMALPRMMCSLTVVVCVVWYVQEIDSPNTLNLWHSIQAAALAAVVLWIFAVVIPMSIASHIGERMVYSNSLLIRAVYLLESPLTPLARFLDEVVRRLAGNQAHDEGEELEAELMSVIDQGKRGGQFDAEEERMMSAVVQLRDKTVEQIMTPRTEISAMQYTDDLGAVTGIIRKIGHSRIPVYKDNLDTIVGVFYVKDLMKWLAGSGVRAGSGKPFELKSILRPALFVPETKTARELMQELLAKKLHIAMVADEYGGTAGLVTIEDIIETVFGDIYDEYEPGTHEEDKVEVDPQKRSAEADARAYIAEVNAGLAPLGVELPEGDDYDTLGGFIITTLGRIPKAGETFRHERIDVTVLEASPTRVLRVKLDVHEPESLPVVPSAGEARAEIHTAVGEERAGVE